MPTDTRDPAPHAAETETPVARLRFSEQFLVWAIRRWVGHRGDLAATWPLLKEGFSKAGALGGLVPLHEALSAIGAASTRSLDVRCERCAVLGEGEALLLTVVAAFQAGDLDAGLLTLRGFLPPAAVRVAAVQLCLLGESLADAGLRLPARPSADALDRPTPRVDRGLALTH